MRYHSSRMDTTEDKIDQGRAMVQFTAEHVLGRPGVYGQFVRQQVDFISQIPGEYLYHEYLEPENTAFTFMNSSTCCKRMTYNILERPTSRQWWTCIIQKSQRSFNVIAPNIYHLEQYMDFLRNRRFRCSLIVNHEGSSTERLPLNPSDIHRIHASQRVAKPDEVKTTEDGDIEESLKELTYRTEDVEDALPITENPLQHRPHLPSRTMAGGALKNSFSNVSTGSRAISQKNRNSTCRPSSKLFDRSTAHCTLVSAPLASESTVRPAVSPMARFKRHQNLICSQRHDMVSVNDPWVRY